MSKDVFREMARLKEKGEAGALATVVARKGSAPMSGDAKMLVREDGSTEGTVGGGCLEAEVWETAMSVLETGASEKLAFDLTQQEAEDSGHICGGVVEILVEPFQAFHRELLEEINQVRNQGGSAALATIVQPGALDVPKPETGKMLFRRDGSSVGDIPRYSAEIWAESTQVIRQGSPTLLQFNADAARGGGKKPAREGATEIFVEPISGQPLVYIFGGGHVSFCVAQAAYLAGFRVSVVEDRPSFANEERFPMAESFFVGEFPEIFEQIPVDEADYLAIITRGHANDEVVLEWAMRTKARYIGMIGSKSKVLLTYRRLQDKGLDRSELIDRVHAPIGLDIGADTPGEIGVAIAAELIRYRRRGEAKSESAGSKRVRLRRKA